MPVGPLLAEGSVLPERGDFAEALTKFEAVLRAEPVTPRTTACLAELAFFHR